MTSYRVGLGAGIAVLALTALAGGETLEFVTDVPGQWITFTGTKLPLFTNEVVPIQTTIGNAVFPAGRVLVGNNGAIGFDPPAGAALPDLNEPIPSANLFSGGQSLPGYWSNLENEVDPGVTWGEIDNRLVVEYVRRIAGTSTLVEFQLQVPEPAPDAPIYAQIVYREVNAAGGGAIATIGYQDGGAGFNDVQWSYNTPGAVWNGLVLTLVPEPGAVGLLLAMLPFLGRRPAR